MALKGIAKKEYQRQYMKEYMRNKRMGLNSRVLTSSNNSNTSNAVKLDADGNIIYDL